MENNFADDNEFSLIENTDTSTIIHAIQDEDEQSLAIFFLSVPPEHAARILSKLPSDKRRSIAKTIAQTETVAAEEVDEIKERFLEKIEQAASKTRTFGDGASNLAKLLTQMDAESREDILDGLEEDDADMVARVEELMFDFDNIANVSDQLMQTVISMVERNILVLALMKASDEVKQKFFSNMPQLDAVQLEQQLNMEQTVPVGVVKQAQQLILSTIRRFEESLGTIAPRG